MVRTLAEVGASAPVGVGTAPALPDSASAWFAEALPSIVEGTNAVADGAEPGGIDASGAPVPATVGDIYRQFINSALR
jgi:hypothetical protein